MTGTDFFVISNLKFEFIMVNMKAYIYIEIVQFFFRFMPPDDPLGRNGPTLDVFLRRKNLGSTSHAVASSGSGSMARPSVAVTPCPYGKKCTYGNKCKFYHAERGNQPQKSIKGGINLKKKCTISM